MVNYFSNFPTITYLDKRVRNITLRARFLEKIRNNPLLFLPYIVRDDDRPEDVAFYYYGDVKFTWLIYLANDMIDPYYDWVLTTDQFNDMLLDKYAELGEQPFQTIARLENTAKLYKNINNNSLISPETFELSSNPDTSFLNPGFNPSEWEMVSIFDFEFNKNEEKRNIFLVNKDFADQLQSEFNKLIVEGS